MTQALTLLAVGDVLLDVDDADACLAPSIPLFAAADCVIGNCEGVYSNMPHHSPSAKHVMVVPKERGRRLSEAPFHVMVCANNHMVDGGYVGMTDTLELLHSQNILTCGAGMTLAEAERPATIEFGNQAIDVHAFCSVFPVGYEARAAVPGINALRVHTRYDDPDPNFWEPGIAPIISSEALPQDLARMRHLVSTSAAAGRFTIVNFHWGYSSEFVTMRDYETVLARDAVDHGADVVLCQHHHSLRGVEIHRGKPIYYGLGTYIHHFRDVHFTPARLAAARALHGEYFVGPRDGFPLFPFHPDARMTGVATIDLRAGESPKFGFVPAMIRGDGRTDPLRAGDVEADIVLDYLERITRHHGFGTGFARGTRQGYAWVGLHN